MRFDAVKFVNHADSHPEDPILRVRPLDAPSLRRLYDRLSRVCSVESRTGATQLLNACWEQLTPLGGVNADDPEFTVASILPSGVAPSGTVFLTLGEPDDVWRVSARDLQRYFGSIWYPGPDDLILIDSDLRWMVGIRHDGAIGRTLISGI